MPLVMSQYNIQFFFHVLDFVGTAGFAAGGALAALRKELDGYGVLVVATAAAVGGGLTRDVLIGRIPPLALVHPQYFILILLTTAACIALRRHIHRYQGLVVFMDALGLGFFAIVGFEAARLYGIPWYGALFLGLVTGTTGGMIKDVLLGEIPTVLRREIYAMACVVGILLYLVLMIPGIPRELNALLSSGTIFLLRIISYRKGWNFPMFRLEKGEGE